MKLEERPELSFTELLNNMDKGFVLRKALYDDSGEPFDFEVVYYNSAMERYISFPMAELKGLTIRHKYLRERIIPILSILTKVLVTGQSEENQYFCAEKNRYIKVYSFRPFPNYVGSFYEFVAQNSENDYDCYDFESKAMQISNSSDSVFWVRKGNRITYVNSAFEKIFGLPCDTLYKDIHSLMKVVHTADYTRVCNTLKNDGLHLETNYNIEFRIITPQGQLKWVWLKTFFIRELTGEISRKAASITDITDRKLMEEELHHQNHEIRTLYELFRKAAEQVPFKEVLERAQKLILDYLQAEGMDVYLYDEKTQDFRLASCIRTYENYMPDDEFLQGGLALPSEMLDARQSRIFSVKLHPDPMTRSILEGIGVSSIFNVPIVYGEKPLGVLSIAVSAECQVRDQQKEFLDTIANQLAVIIHNRFLYEQLNQELEMRRKAEWENELIFTTSIDLIAIFDFNDGRFLRLSPRWEKCLGWSQGEMLSKEILALVHPDDINTAMGTYGFFKEHGVIIGFECRLLCKDGSYRWIAWNGQLVNEMGKELVIATGRDITLSKEIEDKNRELERAYQLETLKMEFFANISHEFRTPLNIILSALQLIQQTLSDKAGISPMHERHYRYLKSIKQNAFRLLKLVNNLIDITKLDSGYFKLYPSNHNIVDVIENITQSVAQYIEGKGISLIFDTDVEEKILACDADLIERILLNLLSNAVKYTEKGGTIKVIVQDLGERVRITVKDTGVGIPEEKLDSIFERFVQGDKPLTRRCEGSGIGLSLVKSLVELHKGKVYVQSVVNGGSSFIFEIPVTISENDVVQASIEPSPEERIHKINVEFSDIYSLNV
ncbi:MAG: PAS domain S-box protein [Clostridia bacterium]|nr:PAS domain S-box protein [Clostridia bacterium]